MKRRWAISLGILLILSLGASSFHPAVHWRLIGFVKGEAFFQGRPTSYWRCELQDLCQTQSDYFDPSLFTEPAWTTQWLNHFGFNTPTSEGSLYIRQEWSDEV